MISPDKAILKSDRILNSDEGLIAKLKPIINQKSIRISKNFNQHAKISISSEINNIINDLDKKNNSSFKKILARKSSVKDNLSHVQPTFDCSKER